MNKKTLLQKCTAYGLLLVPIFLIQSVYAQELRFFGIGIDLIPFAVAAIALFEGRYAGAGAGFAAGVLLDTMSGGNEVFFPIVYSLCGWSTGIICDRYFRVRFLTGVIWGAAISITVNTLRWFIFYYIFLRAGIDAFITTILPEAGVSAIFSPLVYLAAWYINKITTDRELIPAAMSAEKFLHTRPHDPPEQRLHGRGTKR